jgi:hypothetical protein
MVAPSDQLGALGEEASGDGGIATVVGPARAVKQQLRHAASAIGYFSIDGVIRAAVGIQSSANTMRRFA